MSTVRIRVDEALRDAAAEILASYGLTVTDAIHALFERIVAEAKPPFDMSPAPDPNRT